MSFQRIDVTFIKLKGLSKIQSGSYVYVLELRYTSPAKGGSDDNFQICGLAS